ncbi:MAG: cob(I)yrinic acid a,c-diamide adenosyltransferase [Thermoplasmata archaeon]
MSETKRKGLVQVYTGNGKGKTTASLGQVLRAVGKGHKVLIIQFMKGKIEYGELTGVDHLPGAEIEQYGRPDFVDKKNPAKIDIDLAVQGFQRAKNVISSGDYDMVVLDEMNIALDYKLLDEDEVIEAIKNRPEHVEVVLTGRYASPALIDLADLVTVMCEVKHPYMVGIEAREGIEF